MQRIILFTGKGGVGKTSVSAATGIRCAMEGKKTLIISTDPAHSLRDAFLIDTSPEPVKVMENLDVQEISTTDAIKKYWDKLKIYLTALMRSQGVEGIAAEEIATLPGFDEASQLLYILYYMEKGDYDVIIMDTAPTGESLKLLSFPEALSWYMERIFPISRKTAKVVRPFVKPFLNIPLPDDNVFQSIEELYSRMRDVRKILTDEKITTIRLVSNPDTMSFNETKRAYTYLMMYGYNVDSIIVNKIYSKTSGNFLAKWRESQAIILRNIEESFSDIKILKVFMNDIEPTGNNLLMEMGKEIYGDLKPWDILSDLQPPVEFISKKDKSFIKMKFPFVSKEKLELHNRGGELIVQVENWRRVFFLPQSLSEKTPSNAEFNNGFLLIEMI